MARTFHGLILLKIKCLRFAVDGNLRISITISMVGISDTTETMVSFIIPTDFCKQLSLMVIKSTLFMVMSYYHIRCALYMIRG